MRRVLTLAVAAALLGTVPVAAQTDGGRRLSRAVLEDKIRGGWAGQMIGVSYGAPTSSGRTAASSAG